MKSSLRLLFSSVVAFVLLSSVAPTGKASSGGITGRTVTGCSCHNGTPTNTSISFSGPMTVNAGSTNSLTLVVQNSSRPRAGFNMDFVNSSNNQISGLAVVSGQGAQLSGNEMTHSGAKTISGGQATWQFTLNAPTTPGLYTIRVAGNATQSGSSGDHRTSTQTIIVKGVTLTGPTGGSTYCSGGTLPIQWTSYGVSTVNIQLSSDGGANYSTIASPTSNNGSNSFNYTIPASTTAGTTYRVRVVDAADASLVSAMTSDFTITSGLSIVTQPSPASRSACQGATVTYSVVASGASLSYQWRKDGNNLPGATSALLTLANVQTTQAGSYDCVVSSSCGSPATTVAVTLSIDPATAITTQPVAANVCEGSPVNLSVVASGSALQYQWKKGGTDIPGATRSTLNIPMAATADAGSYGCTVTGTCGTPVNSTAAAVSVSSTPVFSTQPKDASQCEGTAATMAASVVNASGLSFEWLKDGVVVNASARVTGVNTQTLNIASLQASDAGTYQLRAFSPVCSATTSSSTAALIVKTKPLITAQPQSRTVGVGSAVEFTVTASGAGSTYQWKKDGNAIAGQTQSTYTIGSAAKTDAGTYTVVVSNECGSVTSTSAVLSVSDVAKPEIVVSSVLTFGTMKVGTTKSMMMNLTNASKDTIDVTDMVVGGVDASEFTIETKALRLPPGVKSVPVRCSFAKVGALTATVTVKSNAGNEPVVTCSATSVSRVLRPESVIFADSLEIGAARDTVVSWCNTTKERITLVNFIYSGDTTEFFSTSMPPPTVGPDSCIELDLTFEPTKTGRRTMYVTVVTSIGTDTVLLTGVGKNPVSSVADAEKAVFVYPSPASDVVAIRPPGDATGTVEFLMIDMQGRTVTSDSWLGGDKSISVQHLPSGVYTMVVQQGARRFVQPLSIIR